MTNKLFYILISVLIISCNKQTVSEKPEDIFEKYKSSVVLIAIEYYYEIECGNSITYYSPSSEGQIFFKKEDVLDNLSFSTGTGFIISHDGEVITNNHVVNPKDDNFKDVVKNVYSTIKEKLFFDIQTYNDSLKQVKTDIEIFHDQLEFSERENLFNRYEYYSQECSNLISLYENIETLDFENSTSKLVINRLGIAFNDTHITNFDDLQECVVIKLSDNENIDLALIQTKSKTFNKSPDFIFDFNFQNPLDSDNLENHKNNDISSNLIKINDDVYMIGYNKGFLLANTVQGIKSQFTSGKISQDPKGQPKILYTIPTLEGSSGSPIVDKCGNLVAVNYAKISNSQNFSFGIPVKEVKSFYYN